MWADEQAAGRADAAELYSEVAALPDKQRAAVVLRDIYGLRYDEVASALGTSRPAVEALLFRGRRRLQRRLRPGLAAGVLVVPLSLHESLAYAVPGFATAAGPAGVAAGVVAMPLLAKVAAVGAAATLAGSTGVIAERYVHDSPARPVDATMTRSGTPPASPARSLVSAGTSLLDARVADTTHEGQSADRENSKDDSETEQSDGVHNDTAEHESSNETTDTTEQADVLDVSIDQDTPDGSEGSHQGSDGHEPDVSRDSTGDSGAASDDG